MSTKEENSSSKKTNDEIRKNWKLQKSDDDLLELWMDKKISDAKLVNSKALISFLVVLLTIFGAIIPLLMSQNNTQRVESAIDKMETKFNILAGKQMRKPEMAAYIDGESLSGKTIVYNIDETSKENSKKIIVKNKGDADTEKISILLYLKSDFMNISSIIEIKEFMLDATESDKPEFDKVYRLEKRSPFFLSAQDQFSITLEQKNTSLIKGDIKIMAILKIFYGEPTAQEIPFTIEIKK